MSLLTVQENNRDELDSEANHFANVLNSRDRPIGLKEVKVLDSTLREGEQSVGVSFTKRQRLQIAWMLDYFGVDFIESARSSQTLIVNRS